MLSGKKLGVIGAGNMAEALIGGVLKSGLLPSESVYACDLSADRREVFSSKLGVNVSASNSDVLACDIILLAVKPQVLGDVLAECGEAFGSEKLIISIAAGIKSETIYNAVKEGTRVVRVMPNIPMVLGEGVSGVVRANNATEQDLEIVLKMCSSAGDAYEITEDNMDALTAVSGSGPAYVFLLAELLAKAGVAAGLDESLSARLAEGTLYGAAQLLRDSADSPEELRRKVTSPGGTTEAAVNSMLDNGIAEIIENAVGKAKERGAELSESVVFARK